MTKADAGSEVDVRFGLRIGGRVTRIETRVPAGPSPVSALLPAVRVIADAVVREATRSAEAAGAKVSCRAGCGACCRQPVPIAESEAFALAALVRSWPEARRRRVEARFREALTTLESAGLLDRLRGLNDLDGADERQAIGRAYFDLALPCPFLEAESCSIHADRPIACREYAVTSPAVECADPVPDRIDVVPIPSRPSVALFRMTGDGAGDVSRPLLLVLALEWVHAHPGSEGASRPGPELLEDYVRRLAAGGGDATGEPAARSSDGSLG